MFTYVWSLWLSLSALTAAELDAVLVGLEAGLDLALQRAKAWSRYIRDIISYIEKKSQLGMQNLVQLDHHPFLNSWFWLKHNWWFWRCLWKQKDADDFVYKYYYAYYQGVHWVHRYNLHRLTGRNSLAFALVRFAQLSLSVSVSVSASVSVYVCLPVSLCTSLCLSVSVSAYLPAVCLCLSVCLSHTCTVFLCLYHPLPSKPLSVSFCVCVSLSLSLHPSLPPPPLSLSLSVWPCLCLCLSVCLSVGQSVCLSVCLSLSHTHSLLSSVNISPSLTVSLPPPLSLFFVSVSVCHSVFMSFSLSPPSPLPSLHVSVSLSVCVLRNKWLKSLWVFNFCCCRNGVCQEFITYC